MPSGTIPQEHVKLAAIMQSLIKEKKINFYVAKQSIYAPTHS